MSEQDTLDKSQEEWREHVESLGSQLHEAEESICKTGEAIESAAETISGWELDQSKSFADNIKSMSDTLIAAIKDRDARIQNLQLKLGQLVERGP